MTEHTRPLSDEDFARVLDAQMRLTAARADEHALMGLGPVEYLGVVTNEGVYPSRVRSGRERLGE